MRRRPAFALFAIVTALLAIAAVVLALTVSDTVRRWSVPLPNADRLVWIGEIDGDGEQDVSFNDLARWREGNHSFAGIAAIARRDIAFSDGNGAEMIPGAQVSAQFFSVAGVHVRIGRAFSNEEDRIGGTPVVVVSDRFWRTRLAGRRDVIGASISLDGRSRSIVGVMPPGFAYPDNETQLWVPAIQELKPLASLDGVHVIGALGRLRPNVSAEMAVSDLARISNAAARDAGAYPLAYRPAVRSLIDRNAQDVLPRIRILIAAAIAILMLGGANVTNMFLAQTLERQPELTVRRAIGGRGRDIFALLLAEALIIVGIGGAGGVLAAKLLANEAARHSGMILPASALSVESFQLVAIAVLASLAIAAGLSVLSYAQVSQLHLSDSLKGGGTGRSRRRGGRVRTLLVAVQVAFTLLLVLGAGDLAATYVRLSAVDLGFEANGVYTAQIARPVVVSTHADRLGTLSFMQTLATQLGAKPGVSHVAITNEPPGAGNRIMSAITTTQSPDSLMVGVNAVTSGFFETLRIPLKTGRNFRPGDDINQPVAIIDATLAKRIFGRSRAIGQKVSLPSLALSPTIVGVVGDVRQAGPMKDSPAQVYLSYKTLAFPWVTILFQSNLSPPDARTLLTRVVHGIDPGQPIGGFGRLDDIIRDRLDKSRFYATLLAAFATGSLLLTAIGLYGTISLAVTQRTFEIGVRVALGASPLRIFGLVIGEAGMAVLIGVTAGLVLTFAGLKVLKSMLYGVSPADPIVLMGAVVAVVICALAAATLPAIRAARIAPATALQSD